MYTGRISGTSRIHGEMAMVPVYRKKNGSLPIEGKQHAPYKGGEKNSKLSLRYFDTSHIQGEKINPKLKIDRLSDVTTRSINRVRRRPLVKRQQISTGCRLLSDSEEVNETPRRGVSRGLVSRIDYQQEVQRT